MRLWQAVKQASPPPPPFFFRAKCVRFSPAGNSFAVASTEGLLVFTQDSALKFAPFELDESVTPDSIRAVQGRGEHAKAVVVSLLQAPSGATLDSHVSLL
jgi:hypothetical protein